MKHVLLIFSAIYLLSCTSPSKDPIDEKVEILMKQMTLEEKVGQLIQYPSHEVNTGPTVKNTNEAEDIRNGYVGSLLNVTGNESTRQLQKIAVEESRLKIPLLFGFDVIHGYKTIFPIPLAEASSWDLEAMEKSARIAAIEASSDGIGWTFAPMVDVARDARWGRVMEGAGEDSYYGSLVAKARIKGFQGESLNGKNSIAACAKHFAAYGAAESGRDYNTVDISENVLREIYLRPFKASVEAGVATFMNSFNEISGVPSSGSIFLNQQILRGEWGFKGFIVSDWNSVTEMISHGFAADPIEAAIKGITAGCDMDMCSKTYRKHLVELVKSKKVNEKLVDESVRRILRIKFMLGLFDDPYKYCNNDSTVILSAPHRQHAREMAAKSCVLLKNEVKALPLSKELKKITLIGPFVEEKISPLGNWAALGSGVNTVSLIEGIKSKLGENAIISYAKGTDFNGTDNSGFKQAIEIAKTSDAIVLALGEPGWWSGENKSRTNIHMPAGHEQLIKELRKLKKTIILVLYSGRPLILTEIEPLVDAILLVWQPGTEGGNAIADVLFNDYNPSGRLSITFPYHAGQVPIYYNYKNTGRPLTDEKCEWCTKYIDAPNKPLYPFGYGLSYTQFDYSGLQLSSEVMGMKDTLKVFINIKNSGVNAGTETVQLYIRDITGSLTRPMKELKNFTQVYLKPGEEKKLSLDINVKDIEYWSYGNEYKAEPGKFEVFVGRNSIDNQKASFELK